MDWVSSSNHSQVEPSPSAQPAEPPVDNLHRARAACDVIGLQGHERAKHRGEIQVSNRAHLTKCLANAQAKWLTRALEAAEANPDLAPEVLAGWIRSHPEADTEPIEVGDPPDPVTPETLRLYQELRAKLQTGVPA